MKTLGKVKPKPAAKRDLFAELGEGVVALAEARQGNRTLRTHALEYKQAGAEDNAEGARPETGGDG